MVAYNFQEQFALKVAARKKLQTIRSNRKGNSRHARPDEALQLYYGMRTKRCQKLVPDDPTCTSVEPIILSDGCVKVGDRTLSATESEALAIADGFSSFDAMIDWFAETHGDRPFEGVLIKWEPQKVIVASDISELLHEEAE